MMSIEEVDEGCRVLLNAFKHRLKMENPSGKYTQGLHIPKQEIYIFRKAMRLLKMEPWYPLTDYARELGPQKTDDTRYFKWGSPRRVEIQ